MGHLTNIIDSLAWPVAALVIVWLLKTELTQLLSRLSNLKWKDLEADFSKGVEEFERQVINIGDASREPQPETPESKDALSRYLQLAQISPRAAISEAWIEVERVTNRLALKLQLHPGRTPATSIVIKMLIEEGLFSREVLNAYYSARNLRNEAAHAPDFNISQQEVERYVELALTLAEKLRAAEVILEERK